jgi:hypothetical protein
MGFHLAVHAGVHEFGEEREHCADGFHRRPAYGSVGVIIGAKRITQSRNSLCTDVDSGRLDPTYQ